MKRSYLGIICCPYCRGAFSIAATTTEGDDIREGTLRCIKCGRGFPIRDGTAVLVPGGVPPEKGVPVRFIGDADEGSG